MSQIMYHSCTEQYRTAPYHTIIEKVRSLSDFFNNSTELQKP